MVETRLSDISAAAADTDLLDRVISAAAAEGVDNPEGWARVNIRRVVAQRVTETGDTPASVYAYTAQTYAPAPRPGQNPAGVTDAYIRDAVMQVHQSMTATE